MIICETNGTVEDSSQDACRRVQRPAVTAAADPNPDEFQLRAAQAWTRAASME